MSSISMSTSKALPVVQALMASKGIPMSSLKSDGRLTLTVDQKYRVHLISLAGRSLVISAQVMSLWGKMNESATSEFLQTLMTMAAGMLKDHSSTLCIDETQQSLLLQQTPAPDIDLATLETELAGFVNALGFWTKACQRT